MGVGTKGKLSRDLMAICASAVFGGGALLCFSGESAKAAEAFQQSFWNTQEIASTNLQPFWKWRAVLERYSQEMERSRWQDCSDSLFSDCPYDDWRRFLHEVGNNNRWGQLVAVNGFVNAHRYMPDDRNWGVRDYWATPGEFLTRSGDCEDYAIAKYLSLKELGSGLEPAGRSRRSRGSLSRTDVGSRQPGEPGERNVCGPALPAGVFHKRDRVVAPSARQCIQTPAPNPTFEQLGEAERDAGRRPVPTVDEQPRGAERSGHAATAATTDGTCARWTPGPLL